MTDLATTMTTFAAPTRRGSVLGDAWTVTLRDLLHWVRQPWAMVIGWFFPIMLTLIFGGLFGGAIQVPGGASYYDFLMPGIFTMTMFFGLEATMMAVSTDAQKGVTDRFRSLPMHSVAVVLGRCIADMLDTMVSLALLIATGLALGWRWHNGPAAAALAVGLLLLLRFAILWLGIYLGLVVKNPQTVSAVQILLWPISFFSNIFVDPTTMPRIVGIIASWNPLSVTANAVRELFGNPGYGGSLWIEQNALLMSVLIPLAIVAIFLPLSARAYRNLGR